MSKRSLQELNYVVLIINGEKYTVPLIDLVGSPWHNLRFPETAVKSCNSCKPETFACKTCNEHSCTHCIYKCPYCKEMYCKNCDEGQRCATDFGKAHYCCRNCIKVCRSGDEDFPDCGKKFCPGCMNGCRGVREVCRWCQNF
jgi:hypothetical protein